MTRRLDPAEYERARTFLVEIAQTLLPEGTTWRTEGDRQLRAGHSGGLSINCRTAAWHFWGEGEGGYFPIILIAKLPGELRSLKIGARRLVTIEALREWLLKHEVGR
jgi:hypothetical protein